MLQWPVIVLLTVSMFVGRVCPVLQKDGHDNSTVNAVASTKNATTIPSNNGTETSKSSVKAVEDKKETLNEIKSSSPLRISTNTNATVPSVNVNEKHNCNSTKEQVDMLNCYVTPHDSGEVTDDEVQSKTTEEPTANKTEANNTESQTQKTIPHKDKENGKSKGVETVVVLLNHTKNAHETTYDVAFTEASYPVNVSDAGTDSKEGANQAEVSISTVAPLLADNAASTGFQDVVGQLKSSDQGRSRRMPSGMIALVTAISFAVAIAIVYIGMIVWRRYIEYRYGHRELLVNELEFDTNDLRHFEL